MLKADAGAAELVGTAVGLAMGWNCKQHDAGKKDGFHKGKVGRNFGTTEAREVARRSTEYFFKAKKRRRRRARRVYERLWFVVLQGWWVAFVCVMAIGRVDNDKLKTTTQKHLSPYFCATMTTEQLKDMRDRVSVLRRFL